MSVCGEIETTESLIKSLTNQYDYLISPIAAGFGFMVPQADMSVMMPVLTGMLGLAGMRSYEKVKQVTK